MEFLGLLVDPRTMMFYLPSHKVTKTIELCKALLQNRTVSLRELAQLLGFSRIDTASCMAGSAAFQTSSILADTTARSKQGFLRRPRVSPIASIERTAMVDFQYPSGERQSNTPSILRGMTITSDTSRLGLDAACSLQTTKGSWSSQERSFHINILELKAAFLAIQSFLKHNTNMSIKLRLDNTTAVYYINNKGGTRSPELMALTMELWTWCLSRNIYIQAEHLPGLQNCLADKASRTCIDSTDWKIQPKLIKQFLVDRDTDLFATRLTHQLPRYVSWHPDPKAIAADAFSLNWPTLSGYTPFPRSI